MAARRLFRGPRLALALALAAPMAGCGVLDWFDDEDPPLTGERIRIREGRGPADAAAAVAAQPLPPPSPNSEWTQTNGRASHASGHLAGPATPVLAWTADAGEGAGDDARITGAPIVAGGRVYALDAEAQLSAFDAGSGSVAWRTDLSPAGEDGDEGFGGGLATDGQRVYATTGFGEVLALETGSGEIAWRFRAGAPFRAAPAVESGIVLAVTRDNRAVGLNARTGEALWRMDAASADTGLLGGASPAIAGDLAVVPFASGEIAGVQVTTGRRVWSAVLGGARRGLARSAISDVTGDPVIAGRAVVAGNQSGRTVAIDGQTGARGWTRSMGAVGPLWAAGGSIFLVTDDLRLTRLALQTGETIWSTELPAFEDPEDREDPIAYSGPVLAGGRVLITDSTGNLLAFDPATGEGLGAVELADGAITGPVVAGGTIYVLSDDGTLQAFR
jgi:outer membrane protein assembly factor BamB